MPLYEYRCEACGQPEEKLESLSAPEVHACPACGAAAGMKRQVSVAAFSLAGGGWYTECGLRARRLGPFDSGSPQERPWLRRRGLRLPPGRVMPVSCPRLMR